MVYGASTQSKLEALVTERWREYLRRWMALPVLLVMLYVPLLCIENMLRDGWGDWWIRLPITAGLLLSAAIILRLAMRPVRKAFSSRRTIERFEGEAVEVAIVRHDGVPSRPQLATRDQADGRFKLWVRIGERGSQWRGQWHFLGQAPDWIVSPYAVSLADGLRFEGRVVVWYGTCGIGSWIPLGYDFTVYSDSYRQHVQRGVSEG